MHSGCSCCSGDNNSENNLKTHWDKAYKKETEKLGWYEESPEPSLQLISKCGLSKDSKILNVGVGASTLIDELLLLGYKNLIANDISSNAIEKLKIRLGDKSNKVMWIVDDLTNPKELNHIDQIDLWHDRAVLHFFNDPYEQECYFNLVNRLVKKNGYVIIAAFNLNGATKCSGLPVFRYNQTMIHSGLGKDFKLIDSFDYTYTNPFGDTREYVYTLFKRV